MLGRASRVLRARAAVVQEDDRAGAHRADARRGRCARGSGSASPAGRRSTPSRPCPAREPRRPGRGRCVRRRAQHARAASVARRIAREVHSSSPLAAASPALTSAWSHVWLPTALPSWTARARTPARAATCRPITKNVACWRARRSCARTDAVTAPGPSSKVSATTPAVRRRLEALGRARGQQAGAARGRRGRRRGRWEDAVAAAALAAVGAQQQRDRAQQQQRGPERHRRGGAGAGAGTAAWSRWSIRGAALASAADDSHPSSMGR